MHQLLARHCQPRWTRRAPSGRMAFQDVCSFEAMDAAPTEQKALSQSHVPRGQVGGSQSACVLCMPLLRSRHQSKVLDVNTLPFISRCPVTLLAQRGDPKRWKGVGIGLISSSWAQESVQLRAVEQFLAASGGQPRLPVERQSWQQATLPRRGPATSPTTASPSEHITPFALTSLHDSQSSRSRIPSLPLSPFFFPFHS